MKGTQVILFTTMVMLATITTMNRVIRRMRGFTLIELIVVIAIIGILATITIIGFSRYQADTRDARRVTSANVIVEALEKYYDANGEYPGCTALTAAPAILTTTTLPGLDPSVLVAPQAPSSETNSIHCYNASAPLAVSGKDFFEYQGDGSDACNTGTSCLNYTLRYKSETNNQVVSVNSRRNTSIATSGDITSLVANSTSFSTIMLTWQKVNNATGYTIEEADDDTFMTNENTSIVGPNGYTGSTVSGLTAGNKYYFRVMPTGAAGTANWSNHAIATTRALATPVITATANSNSQITVTWPNVQYNAGYTLQYTTSGSSWTSPAPAVLSPGTNATSQVVTGLATGQIYYFRLQALAAGNTSDWSLPANATTYVPATTISSAVVNSSTQITVTWAADSVSGVTYTLQYSSTSDFSGTVTPISGLSGLSQAVAGLTQGLTYYFRVYVFVGSASSAASPTAQATTTVDAPGAPGITAYRPGAVRAQGAGWWLITPGAGNWYYAYANAGASCPAGTYPVYQFAGNYNSSAAGTPGPGSYATSGATTGATWFLVQPTSGYKVKFGAQAYCQGASTNSGWSGYNFSCAADPGSTVACTW